MVLTSSQKCPQDIAGIPSKVAEGSSPQVLTPHPSPQGLGKSQEIGEVAASNKAQQECSSRGQISHS